MFIFSPLLFPKSWNMGERKKNNLEFQLDFWHQNKRKAWHIQIKHRKAPKHWKATSSDLHQTLGWSRLCSPAGSPQHEAGCGCEVGSCPSCSAAAFAAWTSAPLPFSPPGTADPTAHSSTLRDPHLSHQPRPPSWLKAPSPFPGPGALGFASRESPCQRAGGKFPKGWWCWWESPFSSQTEKLDLMYELRENRAAEPNAEHIWFRRQRALWEGCGCAPGGLLTITLLSSNKGLDSWTFKIRIDLVCFKKNLCT